MYTHLQQAETALARFTGPVAARSVLQEQASALGVPLEAVDAHTYPSVIERVAAMLEELVGRSAAADFRAEALHGSPSAIPLSPGLRVWRIVLIIIGCAGLVLATGWLELPLFGLDLLQGLVSGLAFACLLRTASASAAGDRSWRFLAAGMGLNACAFLYYWYLEAFKGLEDPFPTVADLFWLLSALALVAGVVWASGRLRHYGLVHNPVASSRGIGVAAVVAVVLITELSVFRVDPSNLGFAISLLYPVLDLVTVGAALMVLRGLHRLGRGRLAVPWRIIAIGMIPATASDLLYAVLRPLGTYQSGSLTDLGWLLESLLMVWAALEMGALQARE